MQLGKGIQPDAAARRLADTSAPSEPKRMLPPAESTTIAVLLERPVACGPSDQRLWWGPLVVGWPPAKHPGLAADSVGAAFRGMKPAPSLLQDSGSSRKLAYCRHPE